MTPDEIIDYYEKLRVELENIPEVSVSNYKEELHQYRRMMNDMIVLGRNTAQALVTLTAPNKFTTEGKGD